MAIVEDEVQNESEDENEIEVVVEEDDADQDSDDSDDDDDEEVLERKVAELELKISEDPYNYNEHIDLIQALWSLTELDRWRAAFERLQQITALRAEHWLLRIQTEETLAHSSESKDRIVQLFQEAALDCYSTPILTEWCTWSLSGGSTEFARTQIDEVLRRAGADPFSGKLYWDTKLELEKAELESMSTDNEEYRKQQERVLWCLEESVSRPLLRGEEAWPPLEELARTLHDQDYVDKIKKQHEAAVDYLQKITPFEDKLLTMENADEKLKVYQEYIDTVKELSQDDKYAECDSDGILKVLYDRASSSCASCAGSEELLRAYARLAGRCSSRASLWRVLRAGTRRSPRRALFWALQLGQADHEGKTFDEVKSIFETALSKGMESFKQAESLWLSYLEFTRRRTAFDNEPDVERLRRTFRLAWDSLAEAWGEEANDCEVPLYWARLEYKRMKDPKQGREIFEEIFKYGENKTMSKYWEALIQLEMNRTPACSEHKLRELMRRALRCVTDYPPAAARLWTDHERDWGPLQAMRDCRDTCEAKLKEWRDNYQTMKDNMIGKKSKGKQNENKKGKMDKNKKDVNKSKNKRKSDGNEEGSEVKRKREGAIEVVETAKQSCSGVKRSHEAEEQVEGSSSKRQRRESSSSPTRLADRESCTLFISNLEFKVNEQSLRDKLSQYGDIVSMRVKAGVKAFGGSICYCQYNTPESVDAALKHDRSPLDGRPMFFSRYSAKKAKPSFKYPTTAEKNKLFVKNLPFSHCTKKALEEVFDKYGKLRDVRIVTHKDGKPKGLAYVEYESDAAAEEALKGTQGLELQGRALGVALSCPPARAGLRPDPAPAPSLTMRRTQLSSFIPSVLLKASTSKASDSVNGDHSNGGEKRPLSNNDFRSMLFDKK